MHTPRKSIFAAVLSLYLQTFAQTRPVYLTLPTDLVFQEISAERLRVPLDTSPPPNPAQPEDFVLDLIHDKITEAEGDVVVLVDACVSRHRIQKEVADLIEGTGFPVYSTPMGKTAFDETNPRYGGVSRTPSAPRKQI